MQHTATAFFNCPSTRKILRMCWGMVRKLSLWGGELVFLVWDFNRKRLGTEVSISQDIASQNICSKNSCSRSPPEGTLLFRERNGANSTVQDLYMKMLTEKGMYRRWAPKEQIIRMIQMLQMIQNLYRSVLSATHTADVWKLIFINLDVNNFLVTSGVREHECSRSRGPSEFMLSESWGRRR